MLHRVRVLGKRLRYAMEIFGDCFETDFKEHYYSLVEQMQECLGQWHDSDVAVRQLQTWRECSEASLAGDWARYSPGFVLLIKSHQEIISATHEKFWTCWHKWEEADLAGQLPRLLMPVQRGELVSIAGNDKTAPGGRDGSYPPVEEFGRTNETVPGGGPCSPGGGATGMKLLPGAGVVTGKFGGGIFGGGEPGIPGGGAMPMPAPGKGGGGKAPPIGIAPTGAVWPA